MSLIFLQHNKRLNHKFFAEKIKACLKNLYDTSVSYQIDSSS